MQDGFLIFQKFSNVERARQIADRLRNNRIEYLVDGQHFFDDGYPMVGNPSISIRLKPYDFFTAREVLDDLFSEDMELVNTDHYLFRFSDHELADIISSPGEWGYFDHQLAKKILRDRGLRLSKQPVTRFENFKKIARHTADNLLILPAYFFAFLQHLSGKLMRQVSPGFRKTFPGMKNYGELLLFMSGLGLLAWISWKFIAGMLFLGHAY